MTGAAALAPGFITRSLVLPRSQNYAFLRAKGLRQIERLAHAYWTDYNVHDPGITILELLCYAVTDVALRAAHPMRDLLTGPTPRETPAAHDFHLAHTILVSQPVSFEDLRKLLIDIPGVRNAWVERHRGVTYALDVAHETLTTASTAESIELNGLFDVYLEYEEFVTAPGGLRSTADVRDEAIDWIHRTRGLCQDVVNVCDLVGEEVAVCADIELRADADTEEVHAEILYRLHHHVSPTVPFHSLEEMQARGRTTDEIFDGPLLRHGFVDDDELRAIRRRCEIRASDVFQIIMDVDGVVAVKSLKLLRLGEPVQIEDWILPLSTDRFRVAVFNPSGSKLTFYKRGLPYYANRDNVHALLAQKKTADIEAKLKIARQELAVPSGVWQDVGAYEPVQNELPGTYCVGRIRVPASDPVRQAQSRQLKAYLMFFDQLLANYVAQLAHVGDLFTWRDVGSRTYFTQPIAGILDFGDLDRAAAQGHASFAEALEAIVEAPAQADARRLRFLHHLSARFAEQFDDYSALMRALGKHTRVTPRLIAHQRHFLEDYPAISATRGTAFDWRSPADAGNMAGYQRRTYRLLDIQPVTRRRLAGHRFDIVDTGTPGAPAWRFRLKDTAGDVILSSIPCESRSAIEALLDRALQNGGDRGHYESAEGNARLVQLCDDDTEPDAVTEWFAAAALEEVIAYFTTIGAAEGFHLVEHILLRRRTPADPFLPVQVEAADECCPPVRDPYSFRISIVLPSWSPRFREMRFRHFVEDMLREEAPAHVYPRICWVNHAQMQAFELALADWEARLATRTPAGDCKDDAEAADAAYAASLQTLITRLYHLTNVYPLAQLHDCEDVDSDTPQVTLGRTSLGTL